MSRLFRRLGAACVALVLVAIACRDRTLSGPGLPRHASIALRPRFQVGTESARPISRIHAVVRRVDTEGTPLDESPLVDQTESVDPQDTSWPVTLDFSITAPVRVIVELELLNLEDTGEGVITTEEWAARVGPLTVTPGRDVSVDEVNLGRGPLPNLDITSVAIGEFPSLLLIGDGASLNATLDPEIAGTRVFWGSLDPAIATIDRSGNVLAVAAGTARLTATAGFQSDTINLTVADPASLVSFLSVETGQDQTATVGTAVAQPIRVRAFDNGENPLRGVSLQFSVTSGGGSIIGPTTLVTDATGNVLLGGWTLGTAAGPNQLQVIAVGTDVSDVIRATAVAGPTFDIVVVSGNNQSGNAGQPLAQPLVARVRDQFGNPVAGQRVNFATANGGTFSALADTSDAQGLVQVTWTPGFDGTSQIAVADIGTSAAQFTASVTLPPPAVQLALASADKVTLNRSQIVNVTLPTPAPAGGASITVTSSAPSVLAVNGGGTLTIAAGQTQGTVGVTGVTEGNATLTATSPQYQNGTLATSVELRVLGLPTTINVPYGQTASLPINIPRPAPAGGITISLSTSDPTRVGLAALTAVIPAGGVTGFVTLNGVLPGPSQIVASHPLYDPDTTAATTTAALDILNTTYQINTSFGTTTTVRFLSNGVPVPAPSPGVSVNVVSRTPTCVSVPATLTIPTGLTSTSLAISYNATGGTTAFPCTSRVVVSSTTGIALDSATVTVAGPPGISVTTATVGAGLQRSFSAVLGASNHGGTTVRITSPDPQSVLIAPNATTAGSAFIDVALLDGNTQANFYVQALDGARGPFVITATATGFNNGSGTATVVTPALDVVNVNTTTTSLTADDPYNVRIGIANGQNTALNELQDRRIGGTALAVTSTVSDPAVIQVVTTAGASTTGLSSITAGNSATPGSVATGGFALRPIGNGAATVTASIPGFITTSPNGTVAVTVTTPAITASNTTVGAGLQVFMNGFLGAAAPTGGATVRITSSDPLLLLVSPNASTAGSTFIDVVVPAGQTSFSFYVQGMNGQTGSPAITLASTGYAAGRATITVVTPALDIVNLNPTTTTLSGDDLLNVRIGIANGQNTALVQLQDVRAGGSPFTVTIVSDTPSVGPLVTSAGVVGGTAQATIAVGQSSTPSSVASGGVALRPATAGVTRVTASSPGVITTSTNGTVLVTVSQPTQTVSGATVGAGLQKFMNGFLGAGSHGGVTVRLTSNNPSRLRLATGATAPPADVIDIVVPNGQTSYSYYIHGIEGQTGTATVTATTPGFANGTGTMTVATPYLDIVNLNTTTTTLTANDDFTVRIGIANANGTSLNELQDIRTTGVPVVATLTTSSPGVAQLVPSSTNGTTATVTIPVGTSQVSGVALDPLTAGTTTVSVASTQASTTTSGGSVTVTVSAPAITLSTSTVGAGLQRVGQVFLGANAPAGGTTVRLTSSQPSVLLLSANATTAGTDFIDVVVPANGSSFVFYVHGVDGQTGTPTIQAKAAGYSDGTSAQPVVAPALDVVNLNPTMLASAADDPFTVRVGIANAQNTGLNELQDRRAGQGALPVTVTNSNAAVGQIANATTRAQSVTVSIAAGQNQTAGTVSAGGVAFDPLGAGSTNVSASIPGFITTITNGTVTVTVQAGLVQAAARSLVGTR